MRIIIDTQSPIKFRIVNFRRENNCSVPLDVEKAFKGLWYLREVDLWPEEVSTLWRSLEWSLKRAVEKWQKRGYLYHSREEAMAARDKIIKALHPELSDAERHDIYHTTQLSGESSHLPVPNP